MRSIGQSRKENIMLTKGMILKSRTKTVQDIFGEVLWEVVEVGMPAPEKERAGQMDGVTCVMLGGSGRAARKGYTVTDSEAQIAQDIANGITEIVPEANKQALVEHYEKQQGQPRKVGSGIEID